MGFSESDRTAVTDVIAMHGHLTDVGELDRYDEIFTADVVYDVTDLGAPPITGVAALRDAGLALGDANPVGHHVTNTVLTEIGDDEVRAVSKAIGVRADGGCASLTYHDTLVRQGTGWRIGHRRIRMHRKPLGG